MTVEHDGKTKNKNKHNGKTKNKNKFILFLTSTFLIGEPGNM